MTLPSSCLLAASLTVCSPSGSIGNVSDERTRFEVLLEEVRSQFGVLADGQESLRQLIDANHVEVTGKIDALATEIAVVKLDVGAVKGDVAALKVRVGKIEHHIGMNGAAPPPAAKRAPARRPKAKK